MRNSKTMVFGLLTLSLIVFLTETGCRRPFGKVINNNKEMAKLIPVLREDVQLIIDKLEILHFGVSEETEYSLYLDEYEDDSQIKISYNYWDGYEPYNFAERQEEFSPEQTDAINYLFFSDELQMNASSVHLSLKASSYYSYERTSLLFHAVFVKSGRYMLGIYYLDPNDLGNAATLNIFRRFGDYVEEIGQNYWIVMWYREH